MLNNAVTVGTPTSTGGKVLTGTAGVKINNLDVSVLGDQATCTCGADNCRGVGPIMQGSPRNIQIGGKLIAMKDDPVDTGCGNCFVLSSGDAVSLGSQMSGSINMGAGVNIGQGVNINMGSGVSAGQGVSFGGRSADVTSSPSVASATEPTVTGQKITSTAGVNPYKMYWPPYDFTAKEGKKQIEVIYRSQIAEIAIFTPEEWKKLFQIWDFNGDVKTVKDSLTGLYNARETAKALGGLGVTAIVRNVDGVEYLFLNNYDKFKQTILHGGVFRADNAQVVKMGIGALDSVKGMTRYVKTYAPAEFLIGSGINGLKYLLTNDFTLRQLGIDEAKILVNAVSVATLAYVLGVVAGATLSVPVASSVVVGLGILAISTGLVWGIDKATDFQEKLVEAVIDEFDEK